MRPEAFLDRPALDVSGLPAIGFDTKSPLWWGNTLLLFIETAMFGILIAIYFTVAMTLKPFPPPQVDRLPVIYDPVPNLTLPIIGLVILLLSLIPGILLDLAARRRDTRAVKILVLITLGFNLAAIIVRYYEFDSLHFQWNDNAYGSITWMILGMHLLHLIVMICEDSYLAVWTFIKDMDDKHALDLTVMAVYWYWIVAVWLILFPIIYIFPRF
ncbi:MAG: heme-copper oxidase subunit III [Pyrinomonadaceae bacterium]